MSLTFLHCLFSVLSVCCYCFVVVCAATAAAAAAAAAAAVVVFFGFFKGGWLGCEGPYKGLRAEHDCFVFLPLSRS